MKKTISKLLSILSLALLAWPSISLADANPLTNLSGATPSILKQGSVYDIVGIIIQTLLGFIGVLFVVMVIWGGFSWMTAGGDQSKIQKARDTIIKATIGLIIIMASYAVVYTIVSQLSGEV